MDVNDITINFNFQIAPPPPSEIMNIMIITIEATNYTIEIADINGKLVDTIFSRLSSGEYFGTKTFEKVK